MTILANQAVRLQAAMSMLNGQSSPLDFAQAAGPASMAQLPQAPASSGVTHVRGGSAVIVRHGHGGGAYGALISGGTYAGADQGIDFTGHARVFAPADLRITRVARHTGWSGDGNIVVGTIISGDHKGRHIYIAEDFAPRVRQGQVVQAGSLLGIATGSGHAPGIEAGWAMNAHGNAYGTIHDGKTGGPPPVHGIHFGDWIKSLRGHG